jgi:hypothetical protein
MTATDHDLRPASVTALARTVYDYERDNPALLHAMTALGWGPPVECPDGGINAAWWVEREGVQVMITFGTVGSFPNLARAAFWKAGGISGKF